MGKNCSHAVNQNFVKVLYDMNEHTFISLDASNKSHTWTVSYFDDKPPECECGIFTSSKVPSNKLQLFFITNIYLFPYTLI